MAGAFKKKVSKAKTVKKPKQRRDPKDVYAEYKRTLEPLVFLDRDRTIRLMKALKEIIPSKVLEKNPDLKSMLQQTSVAIKSQEEVRERLCKLSESDKTPKANSDKTLASKK